MCKVTGCPNKGLSKGYCNAHYIRFRKGKSLDEPLQHKTGGQCRLCEKPVDGKGGWALCKSHFRARRRRLIRAICIEAMGNSCQDCGGVYPHSVYDFHHMDMADKDFSASNMIDNSSVALIAKEAGKCVLLCANCHRVRHWPD